jgi:hypothetical protein
MTLRLVILASDPQREGGSRGPVFFVVSSRTFVSPRSGFNVIPRARARASNTCIRKSPFGSSVAEQVEDDYDDPMKIGN